MKKIILWFILPSLLLGTVIGLCIPYCLVSGSCPTPLLQVCQHSFWDWFLRIVQVVGSIAVVIVALFKEDWMAYRYTPSLKLETSYDDLTENLVHDGNSDIVDSYRVKLRLANEGKSPANNLRVYVDKIVFRESSKSLTSEDILKEPFAIFLDKGNDTVCLPKYGELSTEWLSMMMVTPKSPVDGAELPPQLSMFIGRSFEVDAEHQSGLLDITFKIVCDGMKPQTNTLRVEWNGKWRSRKSDLVSVFGYEWIDFINKK